ncbi:MAG TPA: flagellar M-ring protein FliF C-terminal domain-containing protein [Candidatus Cybelea sp.]|jgi:flagellar M-ring protein FliF|nr:flagellar M-ring protein FliF C-terminal domain-containing protein [Candidatus Cybelea sp.]
MPHALTLLGARWNALPRFVRGIAGGGALAILAVSLACAILTHTPRVALFAAPLHPDQLAEVQERLAVWNVAFTTTADNAIVDARRRNDLLLRLSLAGVPHPHLSSTGEALGAIGVLTPQAVVDAQTRAGLAGDIEAGLRGIDGVDDARVIVAPAKAPEFADESAHDASASVRLRLRAGSQLPPETIDGIRAFVAASVAELAPGRVTILDDRGVALGETGRRNGDAAEAQASLQTALDAAFGEGTTIVRVRAEYANEQISEHDVRRLPVGPQPIAGTRRTESYDGGGKRYRRAEEGADRGSDTREISSQAAPGGLRRLSTAVFVDRGRSTDLAKIRELAEATVGFDARRGDLLAVEAVTFHQAPEMRRDEWSMLYNAAVALAPAVVVSLALIVCVRLGIPPCAAFARSLLERAALERASKAAAGFAPARVRSMLEREPPHAAAAIISALPAATATAVLELYPPHEREAIVRRMQHSNAPVFDEAQELLRRHA